MADSPSAGLVFNGSHLISTSSIRFPINQYTPANHIDYGDSYESLKEYLIAARYCHHYPDIMCYTRHGNGWTAGDEGLWLIISSSDSSGLGSLTVDFPSRWDGLAVGGQTTDNGLRSPNAFRTPIGVTVFITSFSATLRFQPLGHLIFIADVPMDRWDQALYVSYSADPDRAHWFAVYRRVVYFNDPNNPRRPGDPAPEHEHDEL